jgi:hypothetical protein
MSWKRLRKFKLPAMGSLVGFAYGFGVRLLASLHLTGWDVMTIGFLVFMPFVMGCLSVYFIEVRRHQPVWMWLVLPWAPLFGALGAALLVTLEGLICVVMFLPLALMLSSFGGVLGGFAGRGLRTRRGRGFTMTCIAVLPFLIAGWERPVFYAMEQRQVENVIDIQAPPEVVWRNIERVPAIGKDELPKTWAGRIGFPDPIEATLSHEGVGGVRNASFAGGLAFIETVDVWEPERRLAFTIAASTTTPLDEHVRVGGQYFDVLRGEYRLEPLGNGATRLHLSSQQRVSTDFNWYAHLWTDAVMRDLQWRILVVIKGRCEGK